MSNPNSFNAFHIKRAAHAVSRRDASLPSDKWNPFRHVWTLQRRNTWDPENQTGTRPDHEEDAGIFPPIERIQTAPERSYLREASLDEFESMPVGHQHDNDHDLRVTIPESVQSTPEGHQGHNKKPENKNDLFKNVEPKEPFTIFNQLRRTLLGSWINLLLPAVPAGIVLNSLRGATWETFIVNFIAVFPLYDMTDVAIAEIEMRMGRVLSDFVAISTRSVPGLIV